MADYPNYLSARVGAMSGGANPCGVGGEISLYVPRQGDTDEKSLGSYYSEEIVMKIIRGDTNLIEYVSRMNRIHEEGRITG